jgi:hypothetical protein
MLAKGNAAAALSRRRLGKESNQVAAASCNLLLSGKEASQYFRPLRKRVLSAADSSFNSQILKCWTKKLEKQFLICGRLTVFLGASRDC